MLSKEHQQAIFNMLLKMEHPKDSKPLTKKKYKFNELLKSQQDILMLSDSDVCERVDALRNDEVILTEDTYRKIKKRNSQNPTWRNNLMEVLDISEEDLTSNLTDEYKLDFWDGFQKPSSIRWLFESLSDHDKKTVAIVLQELQLLESDIYK